MTSITLFDHSGSDRHVAAYFWVSTDRDEDAFECPEKEVERIIRFGMRGNGPTLPHASPFGHSVVTIRATDIPLFVVHQWQRHRTQNYSEKSLRYTTTGGQAYVPKSEDIRTQVGRPGQYTFEPVALEVVPIALRLISQANRQALWRYNALLDMGVAPELARTVLPLGTLTRMYASASLRNWLNYLVLRDDEHTQLETREAASGVREIIRELYPITYQAWEEYGRRPL